MPGEWFEWELVKETGWTLEYIRDELSVQDFNNWLQIRDARIKAMTTK